MKKIIILLLIFVALLYAACAAQGNSWDDIIIDTMVDIGNNIENDEYTYDRFKYLKYAICEYNKESEAKKANGILVTKIAIGMAQHDLAYINEALIIFQIGINRYTNIIVLQ